jgi:branched-subunit amino acid aminotransferase/4-amino-4-deoxychorismate lyase
VAPRVLALAVSGRGLVPPDQPVIRVDDEAFMRGRGAFESIRVYGGRPFLLAEHLDRLGVSSARLGLELRAREEVEELVRLALEEAGTAEAVLRIYATPGSGQGSVALAVVSDLPPDVDELRARGIRAITVEFRPADLIGGVKSTSYALNMMAVDEARGRGADDAVFVSADGTVLEGTTSNVWWRRGGMLYTPAVDGGILAGVTRGVIAEAAPTLGYEVLEGAFPVADLVAADEAFACSSIREVMPIVALDGRPIGDGKPGRAAATLQTALRERACR